MLPNDDLFSKSVTENIPPNGNLPPQPYVQKTDPPIPSSTPSYQIPPNTNLHRDNHINMATALEILYIPIFLMMTYYRSLCRIKGQEFTLSSLLDDPHLAETFGKNPSIAIFRLAPQDYHRYHAPFKSKLGKMFHVPGTYFTVVCILPA
ncbi:hypothetical protein M407DRAFT_29238 [Tulasnella calospora MUT 4182]|uniref:Phosphatidylserine decarboxylase n=1 Tax=Tulasnella calospora MUT 4182 TaxID=1051891 RepID=A0A0C3PZU9_9AGAM|nr:hypothetical protein M407DRAFT_29238 [Tulasnella calospora MUT 4182]